MATLKRDLHYDQGYLRSSIQFNPVKFSENFLLTIIGTCVENVGVLTKLPHAMENQWGHVDALCDIILKRREEKYRAETNNLS